MRWNQICSIFAFTVATVQSPPPHRPPKLPESARTYVFDCGSAQTNRAESPLPAPCYLIAHPKGTLIWDAGLIPDSDLKKGSLPPNWIAPAKSLIEQLESVGYVPGDITYLSLSHYHSDHTANANLFARSTWLVSEAERDAMFSEKPPRFVESTQFSELRNSKTTILPAASDYDVFGDGTVVIKPAPGHTPGHQVLFVRMIKSGPVLLAGDLYNNQEERAAHQDPNNERLAASRASVEEFLKRTGAQIWIAHDYSTFANHKKAPAFYE